MAEETERTLGYNFPIELISVASFCEELWRKARYRVTQWPAPRRCQIGTWDQRQLGVMCSNGCLGKRAGLLQDIKGKRHHIN